MLLSICAFAPRLWLMGSYQPGTNMWDRAHTYLLQTEAPLRTDIEPAMRWRLLPPAVAYALHLPGKTPLVIPWLGALAACWYVALLALRRSQSTLFAFGVTVLFATTHAVLTATGWLGMNDAWVWLGLLVVSFGRSPIALALAVLLCPWIDERFLFGAPLAWCVRCVDREQPIFSRELNYAALLLPYLFSRAAFAGSDSAMVQDFIRVRGSYGFGDLRFTALGWWMGLRAAWVPIVYAIAKTPLPLRIVAVAAAFAALAASQLFSIDLARSAAILVPLAILGAFMFQRDYPIMAPRAALWLGIAGLLIPAAHVEGGPGDLIDNIVIELARVLR